MMSAVLAATLAIALPDNFNPDLNMRFKVRSGQELHASRDAAGHAKRLVENGTPEDITLAVKVLDAVFSCQELGEEDPNRGNYRWYYEDDGVTDQNAAAFCLSSLIPMMIQNGDRLPAATRAAARESIRHALGAVAALDVTLLYTNITVKDFVNTILGGQLLEDAAFLERGHKKFIAWMQLTDTNGIPVEYNSPTYYRVTIRALNQLAELAAEPDTRSRARTALARLGLSKSLRIHPKTHRMSGPHGRAYQNTIALTDQPERKQVLRWVEDGTMPRWMVQALDHQPDVMEIHETPLRSQQAVISTRHTPAYAFGLATREWPMQANVLFAHYLRPGRDKHGVIYTRYLTDDKWLGSFYHETDRQSNRNLIDEGRFLGVQNGGSAIGVYSLTKPRDGRTPRPLKSAKGTIIWSDHAGIEEIHIGGKRIETLTVDVPDDETVVVISGTMMSAVRLLERTRIGDDTSARIERRGNELVLDIYSYRGDQREHQAIHDAAGGTLYSAFYFEIAERTAYADAAAFSEHVASGIVTDRESKTDDGHSLTVTYKRLDRTLGVDISLDKWTLTRRWAEDGDLGYPMLESPIARQNRKGRVEVGDASLDCGREAGWLFAPGTDTYVAGYHGLKPAPLALTVPNGRVEIEAMGTGTVVWKDGKVTVDAIGLMGNPSVTGGTLIE